MGELSTSDDQGALAFYGALFGWVDEANEIGPCMYYHMQMLMLPQIRLYHWAVQYSSHLQTYRTSVGSLD
jgi:hypothetical protein